VELSSEASLSARTFVNAWIVHRSRAIAAEPLAQPDQRSLQGCS
jgi:hypothetical protein